MEVADRQTIAQDPILVQPPPNCKPIEDTSLTPVRLYEIIGPLTDLSIASLGRCRSSNNFRCAVAQATWATTYWDGRIIVSPFEQAQYEITLVNAFSRLRYPSQGVDGVKFHMNQIWYTDKSKYEAGLTS